MKNQKFHQIPVIEFATKNPFKIGPEEDVQTIVEMMREKGIRHLPVVEKSRIVGIVSDRDVKLIFNLKNVKKFHAKDFMTPEPYLVLEDTPLDVVALRMHELALGAAIITDKSGTIKGIFTSTDALKALVDLLKTP